MSRSGEGWFKRELESGRIDRREFLQFCAWVAASLSLPGSAASEIAAAVEHAPKPTLVWLEFQDCAGNSESFLRAGRPTVAEVILDILSVDYHEVIMASAGRKAEEILHETVRKNEGNFIAVVEGSIPTGENGVYCTIGGKTALQIVRDVCGKADATIAIGTCAAFGGIPAASPNPTGAIGVADAVPHAKNLINLPACPANADNFTALIVYHLTYQRWPELDSLRRPLFAYGKTIHENCERRAHYDASQFVENWGDLGHREGYCLYKVGCKGPVTYQNCPSIGWNEGTNWPIGCGHPCVGCAEPNFWDTMTPFYAHLEGFPGFGKGSNIDRVGLYGAAGVASAFGAHAVVKLSQLHVWGKKGKEAEEPQISSEGEAS
jgi:hydrogenase small subunit